MMRDAHHRHDSHVSSSHQVTLPKNMMRYVIDADTFSSHQINDPWVWETLSHLTYMLKPYKVMRDLIMTLTNPSGDLHRGQLFAPAAAIFRTRDPADR